jgi:hypothetical protein
MAGHLPLLRALEVFLEMVGLGLHSPCLQIHQRVCFYPLIGGFIPSHNNLHSGVFYYLIVTAVFAVSIIAMTNEGVRPMVLRYIQWF